MDKITFQYWKENFKESIFAIVISAIFLGIILYAVVSKYSEVAQSEIVIGELVNFNQIQGNEGSIYSIFIVKLDNENTVRVRPPSHTPIKINQKIELEKRIYENGEFKYYFKKYSNGGS